MNTPDRFGKQIIIEGIIGAGKTTLSDTFDSNKYNKIPEYKAFVGGHENFPKFPYPSHEEALKSIDFFVNLELKRQRHNIYPYNDSIFDRSIISCLAFTYANRIFDTNKYDVYSESIQKFEKLYKENDLRLPNLGIYLKIPYEQSIQRSKQRGTYTGDYFADKAFNEKLIDFYDYFQKNSSNFIGIDGTLDGNILSELSYRMIQETTKKDIVDIFNIARKLD